jgi:hypothetical protein
MPVLTGEYRLKLRKEEIGDNEPYQPHDRVEKMIVGEHLLDDFGLGHQSNVTKK